MRTLNSTLDAAQDGASITPAFGLEWNSTDYTDRLLSYTYRETGQQAEMSEIVMDNRDGVLTTTPPPQGIAVTLSRGMRIAGTDYVEALPRLWVEAVTYTAHACTLHCIDFWGKLARYRYASATSWSNKTPSYIATAILGAVGLSNAGSLTSLSLDFTIPANQRADRALLRLLDKVPEQAYAGQDGNIYFKELDPDENSVYTFGWQCAHPVMDVERHRGAWRYNSITVNGALQSDGSTYTGSASDSAQIALVGTRSLVLNDASLTTDNACSQRTQAELDLVAAAADQTVLTVLPCYGLELFDVVAVLFPPWDASGSYTARVGAYTERYGRGTFTQQVRLYRPARTGSAEIDDLPEGYSLRMRRAPHALHRLPSPRRRWWARWFAARMATAAIPRPISQRNSTMLRDVLRRSVMGCWCMNRGCRGIDCMCVNRLVDGYILATMVMFNGNHAECCCEATARSLWGCGFATPWVWFAGGGTV